MSCVSASSLKYLEVGGGKGMRPLGELILKLPYQGRTKVNQTQVVVRIQVAQQRRPPEERERCCINDLQNVQVGGAVGGACLQPHCLKQGNLITVRVPSFRQFWLHRESEPRKYHTVGLGLLGDLYTRMHAAV